jgi:preprotein translocase subunit SecG
MEFLFPLILTIHILVGLSVIGLVLLQHGKGADMGAAFGGGASGSLFGASGSANFLSRTTGVLATVFFISSLTLSYIAGSHPKPQSSIMEMPIKPESGIPTDIKPEIPTREVPATVPVPVEPTKKGEAGAPTVGKDKATAPEADASTELGKATDKLPTPSPAAGKKGEAEKKAGTKPSKPAPADKPAVPADKVSAPAGKAEIPGADAASTDGKAASAAKGKSSDAPAAPSSSGNKAKEIPK